MPRQPGCWLRSSHTFKECVTAHWSSADAPKINGAKPCAEAPDRDMIFMVGEQSRRGEAGTEVPGGAAGRENAGMSSERQVGILPVESLRFPEQGSSAQGQSGPKPRLKSVGDGQQVKIPVLLFKMMTEGHRRTGRPGQWSNRAKRARRETEANPCFR